MEKNENEKEKKMLMRMRRRRRKHDAPDVAAAVFSDDKYNYDLPVEAEDTNNGKNGEKITRNIDP